MENEIQKDLPKPLTDLPLPEKEIPAHLSSQGQALRSDRKPHIFKSKFFLGFVGLSFLITFLAGGLLLGKNNSNKQVACTLEAKVCPDGSNVGRTGPNCEFAKCPASPTPISTADWKIYEGNGFSFKYPSNWKDSTSESQESTLPQISINLITINESIPGEMKILFYKNNNTDKYLEELCDTNCKTENYSVNGNSAKKVISPPFPITTELVLFNNQSGLYAASVSIPEEGPLYPFNNQNKQIFYQVLSTFKFTDTNPTPTTSNTTQAACTQEAKQCPDGSYVSRTGPNCEFSTCPLK